REREVSFALRQTAAEHVFVPGSWKGFDYEAMVGLIAGDLERRPAVHLAYDSLPEGNPGALPPP
ncbi:MAG TPA: cyclohexanecarboxylate-CoA ligase, partial [Acidimicrobiaceae bacterium]|nr:cyclohexanecarboxylate-CoA ligase [Acidimicrobiaceae bacterium]